MEAATSSPRRDAWSAWASAIELFVVLASILVIIWVLQPLGLLALDFSIRFLVVAAMLGSNLWHGDSLNRLGIRLDNFVMAGRMMLRPTLAAGVALAMVSIVLVAPEADIGRTIVNFLYYLVWGFAQQYALQGFVLLRLLDTGLNRSAPICAATIFAVIHAPNLGLMVLVFLGGWLWSSLFRREPNLFALAISHAFLANAADAFLPRFITGGFRLGPAYLTWLSG